MNRRSFLLILLALVMCLSLVACGDKAITKLTIDEGLSYTYELGADPDFSAVKATVTYNDGSTVTVTAEDLSFSTVDTTTAGTKQLTITYQDFSITVDVTVKGASLPGGTQGGTEGGSQGGNEGGNQGGTEGGSQGGNEGGNQGGNEGGNQGGNEGGNQGGTEGGTENTGYEIMGAEMPANIVAFMSNSSAGGRFTVKKDTYKVGNANPFVFRLSLTVLDENDNLVPGITNYTSVSAVYLVEGTTETKCTDGTYVTIDEENNSFKFTDAAVGKTFRIQTRPEMEGTAEDLLDCTRSLEVEVVAGYNVTNAKELNLMTNTDVEMHEKYKNADERDLPENWQGAIARDYIDLHFGTGYYAQYGDQLKGLVLHCDLTPTVNDIPEAYIANKGAAGEGFDNAFAIYDRYIGGTSYITGTSTPNTFGIYGNYFTINTSGMPMMSDDPLICGSLVASNSWIFRFKNNPNLRQQSVAQAQAFDYTLYPTLIENLSLRDDDPHSNNEADNHRHMFGMNTISINMVDATYDNVIIEAYTISTVISDTNTRLTIKDSVLNNAWQNHIFAWTNNYLQSVFGDEYEEMAPWDNITPQEINIINSKLTKCGGPVILQQCSGMNSPYNAKTGVNLNVDAASELYSYVTGTEAWFKAYPFAATYATNIQAMGPLLQNATNGAASLTTTRPGNGDTQFLNMVFANLSGQAKFTVAGNVLMDTTTDIVTGYKQGIASYGAPLFQSTADPNATATYFEGKNNTPPDRLFDPNLLMGGTGAVMNTFSEGNYINLFFGTEVSVVLGYYHPET